MTTIFFFFTFKIHCASLIQCIYTDNLYTCSMYLQLNNALVLIRLPHVINEVRWGVSQVKQVDNVSSKRLTYYPVYGYSKPNNSWHLCFTENVTGGGGFKTHSVARAVESTQVTKVKTWGLTCTWFLKI